MNNAEYFNKIFGLYANELWSMKESDFSEWLNQIIPEEKIEDTISRKEAINSLIILADEINSKEAITLKQGILALEKLHPVSIQPGIIHCKDCAYWIPPTTDEPCILPSCTFTYGYWKEDDFCSYAVRREEL